MKRITGVAIAESNFILRSRQSILAFIVVPLMLCLCLASIYGQGHIKDLPILVCDLDDSRASRDLIEMFASHETFGQVTLSTDMERAEAMLITGEIRGIIIIPQNFHRTINKGMTSQIMTITDGSNLIYPNMGLTAAAEVIKTYGAKTGYRVMLKEKITPEEGLAILRALSFEERPLYNPTFNYGHFLVMGLLLALWQIIFAAGPAQALARDKDNGSWPHIALSGISIPALLIGKALPYLILNAALLLVSYCLAAVGFGIPLRGSILALLVISLLFVACLTALGIFCSVIGDSSLDATRYTLPFVLPAFVLSGFTWPLEAFPPLFRWIGQVFPLTWMLQGFKSIAVYGGTLSDARGAVIFLSATTIALFIMATKALKKYESQPLDELAIAKLSEVFAR